MGGALPEVEAVSCIPLGELNRLKRLVSSLMTKRFETCCRSRGTLQGAGWTHPDCALNRYPPCGTGQYQERIYKTSALHQKYVHGHRHARG